MLRPGGDITARRRFLAGWTRAPASHGQTGSCCGRRDARASRLRSQVNLNSRPRTRVLSAGCAGCSHQPMSFRASALVCTARGSSGWKP